MYIMCVILYLFNALRRRVGIKKISIIINTIVIHCFCIAAVFSSMFYQIVDIL